MEMSYNQKRAAEHAEVEKVLQHADYSDLDEIDLRQMCKLMQEPVRAIGSCISKGQLQTLCKQLLAQNLALQTQVKKAKEQGYGSNP